MSGAQTGRWDASRPQQRRSSPDNAAEDVKAALTRLPLAPTRANWSDASCAAGMPGQQGGSGLLQVMCDFSGESCAGARCPSLQKAGLAVCSRSQARPLHERTPTVVWTPQSGGPTAQREKVAGVVVPLRVLPGAAATQHHGERAGHDPEVFERRLAADVLEVVPHLVAHIIHRRDAASPRRLVAL